MVGSEGVVEGRGALLPSQHQTLGSGGGRQRGADDEAEVAPAVGGRGGGGAEFVQQLQGLLGAQALLGQRAIEAGQGAAVGVFEELAFGVRGGLGVGRGPP